MHALQKFLISELEVELTNTRKVIANLPDTDFSWQPHPKSMSVSKLAGHLSDLPYLATMVLSTPEYDFTSDDREPDDPKNTAEALEHFEKVAEALIAAAKEATDDKLQENWSLSYGGHSVYDGPRYLAYRQFGLNHIVHHRAQMGVYLRLLGAPVPDTYGPTADEGWKG